MLLRAETFLSGVLRQESATPRDKVGAKAVQVYSAGRMVWSKKPIIIRNAPHTIENPTLGQMEIRIKFGELAKEAKGCIGLDDGLPCVAKYIKDNKDKLKTQYSLPKEEYPSRVKRSFHTLDELKKMFEKAKEQVEMIRKRQLFDYLEKEKEEERWKM